MIVLRSYRLYKTTERYRVNAKRRRDENRASGTCINGSSHGNATHGVLCEVCRETHRRSQ